MQQSDVYQPSVSTCFGHHYAHLQENEYRVLLHMVYYYQLLSRHVSGIIMPIFRRTKTVCYCIWCVINFCLNMFRASLCLSSGDRRPCVTAYGVLLSTSVSTCFGHHYAHLQEIEDRVLLHMVYYYQLLSQHVSGIIMPIFRSSKTVCYCIWCIIINFCLNMFRASLCPSSGERKPCVIAYGVLLSTSVSVCFGHHYAHLQENKDRVLLHTVYCAGSAGCGW